jgi:hypothetical protein
VLHVHPNRKHFFSQVSRPQSLGFNTKETFMLGIHYRHTNYNCKNDNEFKQIYIHGSKTEGKGQLYIAQIMNIRLP